MCVSPFLLLLNTRNHHILYVSEIFIKINATHIVIQIQSDALNKSYLTRQRDRSKKKEKEKKTSATDNAFKMTSLRSALSLICSARMQQVRCEIN